MPFLPHPWHLLYAPLGLLCLIAWAFGAALLGKTILERIDSPAWWGFPLYFSLMFHTFLGGVIGAIFIAACTFWMVAS